MVIWLIGLSGAGKTTIGFELYQRLREKHKNTVFLDGDILREVLGGDLGFTVEDRKKSAVRQAKICKMLNSQGIHVVCCILSNQPDVRQWNRDNIEGYYEVYIDVSLETLKKRDPKGLYRGAEEGKVRDVVGVDIEFFPPTNPDITINNNQFVDLDECVQKILEQINVDEKKREKNEEIDTAQSAH